MLKRRVRLLAVIVPMVVAGCGGYDPEYQCEQELACEGGGDEEEIALCADLAEVVYDHASDKEKEQADDAYEACKDKKSCEYVTCTYAEIAGVDTDDLSKAGICEPCAESTYIDTCNESYDYCAEDSECALVELALAFAEICADEPAGIDCGDDYADELEQCDGSDLWDATCYDVTDGSRPNGVLSCDADCTFNTSMCTP